MFRLNFIFFIVRSQTDTYRCVYGQKEIFLRTFRVGNSSKCPAQPHTHTRRSKVLFDIHEVELKHRHAEIVTYCPSTQQTRNAHRMTSA